MVGKYTQALILLVLVLIINPQLSAGKSLTDAEVLKRIVDQAKVNEERISDVGFQQVTAIKKITDGKVSSEKVKKFRATWIQNKPYLEMVQVDGKELNTKEKKEEEERKRKFVKSLTEKDEDSDDFTWDEMYAKYDFESLHGDSIGRYVFKFKPKAGKLQERSRTEKILNHLTGTFWADENFNIVRAEARLMENVRFGLGILGKLEKLDIQYGQQTFEQLAVPSYFNLHFKARVAMVKSEERHIESTYSDFFRRQSSL